MNSVTIIWSMMASACLVLALVHGFVWFRRHEAVANLMFSLVAASTAGMSMMELWMLQANTVEEYGNASRWLHVPVWVLVVSLVGFVRSYLGTGGAWLGWAVCGLRTLSLVPNFLTGVSLNYQEITAVEKVRVFGLEVTRATGVPNPWMLLGQVSLVLLVVFVINASWKAWGGGAWRRAGAVGISLVAFVVAGTAQAVLVFWELTKMPLLVSPFFMGLMLVMAVELGVDVLRAERLARDLRGKDAELRDSQERLRLAADAANAGLWSLQGENGLVWATPKALEIFGLRPGPRYYLADLLRVIHPEDRERVEEMALKAQEAREVLRIEYRVVLADGRERWLTSWGRVWRREGNGAGDLMGVTVDVTERRALEDEMNRQRTELAHLSRVAALSELSGSLAHELNQPLAIILSNAQAGQRMLSQESPDLIELREIIADIISEDRRAGEVIRRLRAMLKRGEANRMPIAVNELIQEVLQLTRSDLIGRGVSVRRELAPELPLISGDRIPLEQVLLNLIINACDAVSGNGVGDRIVGIRSRLEGGAVHIAVEDNGCGLPEDAEAVFAAFYTTKPGGLGMGLSICRTIVGAHGGRIWGEKNGKGGATFHLSLPVAEKTA